MAECNCSTSGSLLIIKQGDAYDVQVSLTFNGEPIDNSNLDLVEEIEFTFGELAPMKFKPADIYNTTIGAFLVPLTQEQTFGLEDGKILVDCRVQFYGGDVVGVSRMARVFVREALSGEILSAKPFHGITPSAPTPADITVLPLTVIANGTYTAPSGTAYSPVVVNVPQESGGSGDSIDHEDLPSYVKSEARSVAARVAAKMQNDSIVFMVGSDSHESDTAHVSDGNLHAGMAMKALAYFLPLDFAAYLGDYSAGSDTTTIEEGLSQIAQINEDIAEAFNGLPQFRTVGNHDPLGYSYNQNGTALTQEQLYALVGKYNADAGNVMGSTVGGYCHRDFASKRIRVICLNTAETDENGNNPPHTGAGNMSAAQKTWFAQTMASTPNGYGLIILSHHPLDWISVVGGGANLVYDYINGSDYKAAYVLAFHGHVHCFKVDFMNRVSNYVATPYGVKRIAVPNMCHVRDNEYGTNPDRSGIVFGESTTYPKTADSGDDTAFCVMVVNPTEQKVHAICYGAGYDREVFFGTETVAVTGVTLSSASGTLNPGGSVTLAATVAPANATNKTVLWSTSDATVATVSNGVVTAVAEGTATITATTQDGGYTATFALTVEAAQVTPRGNLIGEIGYFDNKRISESAGLAANFLADAAGYVTTGNIDCSDLPNVIRIKGANFDSGTYWAAYWGIFASNGQVFGSSGPLQSAGETKNYGAMSMTYSVISNTELEIHVTETRSGGLSGIQLRFCGYGSGANLDIRINEDFDD